MLRSFTAATLSIGLLAGASQTATAAELKGVVELFTSQGCSSCPPADAELSRLIDEGDVLALAYHVDYWNYLGWKDTLSSAENTQRQYDYAKTLNRRGVYTPQALINGRNHTNGADGGSIRSMIDGFSASHQGLTVKVDAKAVGDTIRISIAGGPKSEAGKADIVMVYFDDANTVDIKRGENTGRKITYRHSVREIETIGMWSGTAQTIELPKSVLGWEPGKAGHGCAVLLQRSGPAGTPAEIIGAAVIDPETQS